jgi:hypothetical protein
MVVLCDRDLDEEEKIYRGSKKQGQRYPIGILAKFHRVWCGDVETEQNTLFQNTF